MNSSLILSLMLFIMMMSQVLATKEKLALPTKMIVTYLSKDNVDNFEIETKDCTIDRKNAVCLNVIYSCKVINPKTGLESTYKISLSYFDDKSSKPILYPYNATIKNETNADKTKFLNKTSAIEIKETKKVQEITDKETGFSQSNNNELKLIYEFTVKGKIEIEEKISNEEEEMQFRVKLKPKGKNSAKCKMEQKEIKVGSSASAHSSIEYEFYVTEICDYEIKAKLVGFTCKPKNDNVSGTSQQKIINLTCTKNDECAECPICYEKMEQNGSTKIIQTDCDHCFHGFCFKKCMERQKNCPICRAFIDEKQLNELDIKLKRKY